MLIILLILIAVILLYKDNVTIEGYYDITPYEAHWNIFKCLDPKCIKDRSYKCYKWCNNWSEPGGQENCRLRCADYADEMFNSLKFQNYTWNYLNPRFRDVSLLNTKDDIVEWTSLISYPPIKNKQYTRQYNNYFNEKK
jgi:hypothetical protein